MSSVDLAVLVSFLSVVAWAILFGESLIASRWGSERRRTAIAMGITGLLASVGTLASALGFAQSSGELELHLNSDALSLVASMGRGALLMGAVIALFANRKGLR